MVDKGPGKRGGFSGFVLGPVLEPQQPFGGGQLGPLVTVLPDSGATSVTVVGIATDVCVSATAHDAVRLGYPVTVPLLATAPVHAGEADLDSSTVAELLNAGITLA